MSTIIDYRPINTRNIDPVISHENNETHVYSQLFNDFNIFDYIDENIYEFHSRLKNYDSNNLIDSILICFDGFKYFINIYDYILRSDLNIIFTPMFAKWQPLNCNDFVVKMD